MGSFDQDEARYQRQMAEMDAFVDWCERNDIDPEENGSWDKWQEHLELGAEAEAERRAEARADAWDGPY